MSYYEERPSIRFGPAALTPAVRGLMASCVGLFLLQRLLDMVSGGEVSRAINHFLGLVPQKAVLGGHLWQFVSYLFVHGTITHILFNMLFLWWFGAALESLWGTRRFLKYYFGTGVGAAVIVAAVVLAGPDNYHLTPVVGASGAIFGLLAAYGVRFGDNIIHVMLIFPMRARYAVLLFALIELVVLMEHPTTAMGALAHLSGMGLGYLYLRFERDLDELLSGRRARKRRLKLVVSQPRPMDRKRYIEDQIDPILDKINEKGMESLTQRERAVLEKFHERGD